MCWQPLPGFRPCWQLRQQHFAVIRHVGAAYLIAMGIYEWRKKRETIAAASPSARRLFVHGFSVQILNPKVAVFFVAYLPQFVDPNDAITPQIMLLGFIYIAIACASDTAYVLLSSVAARRIVRSSHAQSRMARFSAATYIGLGLFAALSGPRVANTARA
jgi:threonine/homoserine/homoserine lactone efflux protein